MEEQSTNGASKSTTRGPGTKRSAADAVDLVRAGYTRIHYVTRVLLDTPKQVDDFSERSARADEAYGWSNYALSGMEPIVRGEWVPSYHRKLDARTVVEDLGEHLDEMFEIMALERDDALERCGGSFDNDVACHIAAAERAFLEARSALARLRSTGA